MKPLPRIGLGCAPIGNLFEVVSDEQAHATIDAAWEAGVRFFDTAPLYGHGLSEKRVGEALRKYPRDEYVLCTKVGRLLVPGSDSSTGFVDVPPLRPEFDFSADGVNQSLDESLARLGLDRIDVALVHDPDDHFDDAIAGAFPALIALRDQGVIGAVGSGMNQAAMLTRFVHEVDIDCVLEAGRYTLLEQPAADELFPACLERGVSVIAAGVFNSGLLAGGTTLNYEPAPLEAMERVRGLEMRCHEHDVSLKAAALQFAARHPAVTCVLMGAKTPDEVTENVALVQQPLPDELWDDLP